MVQGAHARHPYRHSTRSAWPHSQWNPDPLALFSFPLTPLILLPFCPPPPLFSLASQLASARPCKPPSPPKKSPPLPHPPPPRLESRSCKLHSVHFSELYCCSPDHLILSPQLSQSPLMLSPSWRVGLCGMLLAEKKKKKKKNSFSSFSSSSPDPLAQPGSSTALRSHTHTTARLLRMIEGTLVSCPHPTSSPSNPFTLNVGLCNIKLLHGVTCLTTKPPHKPRTSPATPLVPALQA